MLNQFIVQMNKNVAHVELSSIQVKKTVASVHKFSLQMYKNVEHDDQFSVQRYKNVVYIDHKKMIVADSQDTLDFASLEAQTVG